MSVTDRRRKRLLRGALLAFGLFVALPVTIVWQHPRVRPLKAAHRLHRAMERHDTEAVASLLKQGADPDFRVMGTISWDTYLRQLLCNNDHWRYGPPTWFEAARQGDAETLRLLLDWGVDPNAHDGTGGTALREAGSSGDRQTVQLLLDHGADPLARWKDGGPIWEGAESEQHDEIVKMLKAAAYREAVRKGKPIQE